MACGENQKVQSQDQGPFPPSCRGRGHRNQFSFLLPFDHVIKSRSLAHRHRPVGATTSCTNMLAQLFEEDSDRQDFKQAKSSSSGCGVPRPSAPRSGTRLCGLSNLGATCYMNALLQTLHFTPEFRGSISEEKKKYHKFF